MKVIGTKLKDEIAEKFEKIAEKHGISKSELLRFIILEWLGWEGEIEMELERIRQEQRKKNEFCRKLYAEMGKIGGNLNQIARAMNRRKTTTREKRMMIDLVTETLELVQELKTKLRG